jgi:lipopolysaccharide transport system permease protein
MTSLPIPDLGSDSSREMIIAPKGMRIVDQLRELWQYRDLAWFLALRDIQVRYKQTLMGGSWAIIQPVMMMVVFTMVFGRMLGVADGIEAYPVFVYAGLLPWTFFTASVSSSSMSVIGNAAMLRKIYFPRLMVPLVTLGAPLMDLMLAFGVLAVLMFFYGIAPTWSILLLPLLIGSIAISAAGIGLMLASLTIRYRDVRHIVPYLLQIWLFITPVIYPLDIGNKWRIVVDLNPVAGTIEAFRAVILGTPVPWDAWGLSVGLSLGILAIGTWRYSRSEQLIADLV